MHQIKSLWQMTNKVHTTIPPTGRKKLIINAKKQRNCKSSSSEASLPRPRVARSSGPPDPPRPSRASSEASLPRPRVARSMHSRVGQINKVGFRSSGPSASRSGVTPIGARPMTHLEIRRRLTTCLKKMQQLKVQIAQLEDSMRTTLDGIDAP